MKTGIYTITNLVNSKIYVGCTLDFTKRKSEHFKKLQNNIHKNKHLQSSFNKYGKDNFVFEILIECTKEILGSEEHYWCNILKVHDTKFGYNQRPTHPYNKIVHTPEMIEKMRNSLRGRKLSAESIRKRTETRRKNAIQNGYYHSPETRKLMSDKRVYVITDNIKLKISKTLTGRKFTQERINKAIEGRKGYKHSQETINKIKNANRKNGL